MRSPYRLERRQAPDYERVVAVLERRGDRAYVPFYEMLPNYFPELSGDMGHKTGTMREYFLPWHQRAVEAAHRHGKKIVLHSCGNLAAIMPDIVAYGFDGKHSFEDTIEPGIVELNAQYGDRIALLGGIDVDFLCRASEAQIRQRARDFIDTLAPNRGYCLGSGNSIPDYVPIERYWAMLDEGLNYGRG